MGEHKTKNVGHNKKMSDIKVVCPDIFFKMSDIKSSMSGHFSKCRTYFTVCPTYFKYVQTSNRKKCRT